MPKKIVIEPLEMLKVVSSLGVDATLENVAAAFRCTPATMREKLSRVELKFLCRIIGSDVDGRLTAKPCVYVVTFQGMKRLYAAAHNLPGA